VISTGRIAQFHELLHRIWQKFSAENCSPSHRYPHSVVYIMIYAVQAESACLSMFEMFQLFSNSKHGTGSWETRWTEFNR